MAGGNDTDGGSCGDGSTDGGSRSRRGVLRAGASVVVTGAVTGSAGCLATLPPLGQRVRFGRVDAPARDDAAYTEWVPDGDAIDGETVFVRNEPRVMYVTPGDLGETELGAVPSFPTTFVKSRVDYFGHGFESYDEVVQIHSTVALVGDVDRELAGTTATESGYESVGPYEGYDAYSRSDPERAVLVGDDVIVWADGSTALTDVEALVDARDGRIPRLDGSNGDFAKVTGAAGGSPWTWVFPNRRNPEAELGATWTAANFEFDASAAYYTQTYLFPAGETPSRGAVQDWLEKRDRPVDSEAVDVGIDGRVVEVEMRMAAEKYRRKVDSDPAEWPQITWSVARDGETVTVTHEAGDTASTDWLGGTYYPSRTELTDAFGSAGDTLEPGDSVTVDFENAPEDQRNLSIWVSPPDDESKSTMLSVPVDPEDA